MKLTLDHTQRLNLHALLGAQRGDVATIRALWALQDRLALTPEEESAIEVKREFVGGQDRVLWNPAQTIPLRDIDFADIELNRIKVALESWDGFSASSDRQWLEPLVNAIVKRNLGE